MDGGLDRWQFFWSHMSNWRSKDVRRSVSGMYICPTNRAIASESIFVLTILPCHEFWLMTPAATSKRDLRTGWTPWTMGTKTFFFLWPLITWQFWTPFLFSTVNLTPGLSWKNANGIAEVRNFPQAFSRLQMVKWSNGTLFQPVGVWNCHWSPGSSVCLKRNALQSNHALRTLCYTYFRFKYFFFNVIFAIRTKILLYVLYLRFSISFCILCLMYSDREETRHRKSTVNWKSTENSARGIQYLSIVTNVVSAIESLESFASLHP